MDGVVAVHTIHDLVVIFRSHEDDGQVRLCPTCGKEFRKKNDLYAHMRRHTNPKRFLCPKCGKAFKSASTFCSFGDYRKIEGNRESSTNLSQIKKKT